MTTSPLFKRPLRNGWFSMESAPRTGETIMLYESGRGVFEGWWKQTEYEAYWMDLQDSEPDPVAWRPILPGPHEVVAASHEPPAEEVETLRERVKELTAAHYEIANRAGNMCDDDAADWLPSIYKIACDVTGENPEPLLEAYASYRARAKGNG